MNGIIHFQGLLSSAKKLYSWRNRLNCLLDFSLLLEKMATVIASSNLLSCLFSLQDLPAMHGKSPRGKARFHKGYLIRGTAITTYEYVPLKKPFFGISEFRILEKPFRTLHMTYTST